MSHLKKLIRERFRDAVFARDKHKCKFCARTDSLDAHHITDRNEMPNGGYVLANGITLCPEHHLMAEGYHQGNPVPGFLPEDLYKAIGSSRETAVLADSKRRHHGP